MEVFGATLLFVSVLAFSYLLVLQFHELEKYKARIRQMSQMLQLAEYRTGVEYYTCLNSSAFAWEISDWLYDAKILNVREGLAKPGVPLASLPQEEAPKQNPVIS